MTASPGVAAHVTRPPLRPWDRTTETKSEPAGSRPAVPAIGTPPRSVTPAFTAATATRIDITHPATMLGRADIGRRVRVARFKQAAAIAVWLTIIAIIVLILFVGSRPAAPDFTSYARLIA